jgi:hypothetical protein
MRRNPYPALALTPCVLESANLRRHQPAKGGGVQSPSATENALELELRVYARTAGAIGHPFGRGAEAPGTERLPGAAERAGGKVADFTCLTSWQQGAPPLSDTPCAYRTPERGALFALQFPPQISSEARRHSHEPVGLSQSTNVDPSRPLHLLRASERPRCENHS